MKPVDIALTGGAWLLAGGGALSLVFATWAVVFSGRLLVAASLLFPVWVVLTLTRVRLPKALGALTPIVGKLRRLPRQTRLLAAGGVSVIVLFLTGSFGPAFRVIGWILAASVSFMLLRSKPLRARLGRKAGSFLSALAGAGAGSETLGARRPASTPADESGFYGGSGVSSGSSVMGMGEDKDGMGGRLGGGAGAATGFGGSASAGGAPSDDPEASMFGGAAGGAASGFDGVRSRGLAGPAAYGGAHPGLAGLGSPPAFPSLGGMGGGMGGMGYGAAPAPTPDPAAAAAAVATLPRPGAKQRQE